VLVWLSIGCASSGLPAGPPPWREAIDGWHVGEPIPDVPLVDQDGRAFRLRDRADGWLLVAFVFTRCAMAEACPLVTRRMREIQDRHLDLRLLSITIDPAWDTPAVLKAYADAAGADPAVWTFATGDADLVTSGLPSLFDVLALPSDGTIRHNVKVALLKPGLIPATEWTNRAPTADEVATAMSPPR
jgi:protein SCO1/2